MSHAEKKSEGVFAAHYQRYVSLGYSPIPLFPLDYVGPDGKGRAKQPCIAKWDQYRKRVMSPAEASEALRLMPFADLGAVASYGKLVVVDVDTYDARIQSIIQKALPNARLVRLGDRKKGGCYLFRWADEGRAPHIKYTAPDGSVIVEIISRTQIVMPPSTHPSGDLYAMARLSDDGVYEPCDLPPLSALPTFCEADRVALVAAIEPFLGASSKRAEYEGDVAVGPIVGEIVDDARAKSLALRYLATAPVSISGRRGHDTLVRVAQRCGDFGLTLDSTLDLLVESGWNARCAPPWSPDELGRHTYGLDRSRRSPLGCARREYQAARNAEWASMVAEDDPDEDDSWAEDAEAGRAADALPPCFHVDCNADIRPTPLLVKQTLPFDGLAFIGGQSGVGKSFLVAYLAVCLTTGTPFFGRKIKEKIGIVIMAAEGQSDMLARIRAARESAGFNEPLPIVWIEDVPDISNVEKRIKLANDLKQADRWFRKVHGVRLGAVVIDTVAAAISIQDENSNAEVSGITRVMRELGGVTKSLIVAVHHFGKNVDAGFRGAYAWQANTDVALKVTKNLVEIDKNRYGPEGPVGSFDLPFKAQGIDEDGDVFGTLYLEPRNEKPDETQDHMAQDDIGVALAIADLDGVSATQANIRSHVKLSHSHADKGRVNRAIGRLADAKPKQIKKLLRGRSTYYRLTTAGEQLVRDLRAAGKTAVLREGEKA